MKLWSGFIFGIGLFSSVGLTQQSFAAPACLLTLEWQSSSDPSVTGYALYYGPASEPTMNRVDVGLATSLVVTNLTAATDYSFYVVAYDLNLEESDPSNFLLYTAKAISGLSLSQPIDGSSSISFTVAPGGDCHVEYTDTLAPPNWQFLTAATGDANGVVNVVDNAMAPGGSRFYRVVVP